VAEPKELVASAIVRAQADLNEALSELEKLPAFDPGAVAFAAHALNNYLTVTEGALDLVLAHLANYPDPQLRVWLEGVQHATNLMRRTVSQLMSASVTGETKLRFERVDLGLLVQRACNYYQRAARQKTIRIVVDAAIDVPMVWTDRVAVAAVLDNLLSNAAKYSDPGKQVTVQVRGEPGWAVCVVRDEGPGLSQADQARLFKKGIRLTPKPTAGESSTGFGLAVAKELIDKLHGQIWCESVLGQGCCFSFRLPAYLEPTPPVPQPGPPARPAGPAEAGGTDSGPAKETS
jgi:signal transduction histidine kinase